MTAPVPAPTAVPMAAPMAAPLPSPMAAPIPAPMMAPAPEPRSVPCPVFDIVPHPEKTIAAHMNDKTTFFMMWYLFARSGAISLNQRILFNNNAVYLALEPGGSSSGVVMFL